MDLKSKTVLVTGADGFIGSHLTEALVQHGARVRAFVWYNSFNSLGWLDTIPEETRRKMEIISGDIRDPFFVHEAIQGCDVVMHLAALIAIPFSYKAPANYIETNIQGTLNVLQAAKQLGVQRVIHTSTSEVYGTAQFTPITEEHPLVGQSPYSASKIGADQLAYSFFSSFDLPVAIVRPFNTYGPRQSARAIIPTVISQIASGILSIKTGNIKPLRDFNYIDDTVAGFIAAAESENCIGEVINLCSGFEVSIEKVIALIAKLMKVEIEVVQDPARIRPEKSEVNRLLGSNEKALRLTKWKPRFGSPDGFEEGLLRTIQWLKIPENLKKYKAHQYNI